MYNLMTQSLVKSILNELYNEYKYILKHCEKYKFYTKQIIYVYTKRKIHEYIRMKKKKIMCLEKI